MISEKNLNYIKTMALIAGVRRVTKHLIEEESRVLDASFLAARAKLYLKEGGELELEKFEDYVFIDKGDEAMFRHFLNEDENYDLLTTGNFTISGEAFAKEVKSFSTYIYVGKEVYLSLKHPNAHVEQGYDSKKGKCFFKIYYKGK